MDKRELRKLVVEQMAASAAKKERKVRKHRFGRHLKVRVR